MDTQKNLSNLLIKKPFINSTYSGSTERNSLKYIAFVIFSYVVGIFLYTAFFAFPQTDDFCIFGSVISTSGNPLSEVYKMYLTWSGRYSAIFFISLPAWVMSISPIELSIIYRFFIFLYMASFLGSLYCFFKTIELEKITNILISLIMFGLILIILPSKVEGLYWLTGSSVYLLSVSAFMMLASALQIEFSKCPEKNMPNLSTALFIVAVVGFNELIAISAGLLLGLHFFLQPSDKRNNQKNLWLVIILFTAMLVSVLAPGNFLRNDTISIPKHQIGLAFSLALKSINMLWKYNIGLHQAIVFCAIIAGFIVGVLSPKKPLFKDWRAFLAVPIAIIFCIPIHFFVYSYLTGEETPGRTLNQSTELLWIGVLMLITLISSCFALFFRNWKPNYRKLYEGMGALGLILASLGYVEHKEFKDLNYTLRVFAPKWVKERFKREQQIDLALSQGDKSVEVDALSAEPFWPPFLKGTDITEDSKYWVNMCTASYYHLDQITVKAK